jgi:hypothetical protein
MSSDSAGLPGATDRPWRTTTIVLSLDEPEFGYNERRFARGESPILLSYLIEQFEPFRSALPVDVVTKTERLMDEAREQVVFSGAKTGAIGNLVHWLRHLFSAAKPLSEPGHAEFVVPVLLLGAPAVPEAQVVWTTTTTATSSRGVTVTVSGTGYGKTEKREVSEEITEACEAGQIKRITAHFLVEITPMGFFSHGKQQFEYVRAGVAEDAPVRWVAAYCDLRDVSGLLEAGGQILDRTQVPGDTLVRKDTKGLVARRSVSLGVSANYGGFNLDSRLSADVHGSEKYEIRSTLPGGHAYRPYAPHDGLGLVWMEYPG